MLKIRSTGKGIVPDRDVRGRDRNREGPDRSRRRGVDLPIITRKKTTEARRNVLRAGPGRGIRKRESIRI